jgi:tetratricopeptide (TPR) repeat protein
MTIRTWQERQIAELNQWFVGRKQELSAFSDHVATSNPTHLLIAVSGQGGVGKTALLRRYMEIARQQDALTGFSEAEIDPIEVLGCFAGQLKRQNCRLRRFEKRFRAYSRYQQQILADPEAPQGALDLSARRLGGTAARAAVISARRIPAAGLFFDFVDENAAGEKMSAFTAYLSKKINNIDDFSMMQNPIGTLTSCFLGDLNKAAYSRRVVLLFDNFEFTRLGLESWLHKLLTQGFGELGIGISIVISGRHEVQYAWSDLAQWILRVPLGPFSCEEASEFLISRNVTDTVTTKSVMDASKQVPVLMELLVSNLPEYPQQQRDMTGEAIDRFLQWVDDPDLRHAVLLGAVPRRLNQDIFTTLVTEAKAAKIDEGQRSFQWLLTQPFIFKGGDGYWQYHSWVRELMLRHLSHLSPSGYAEAHRKLLAFYTVQHEELNSSRPSPLPKKQRLQSAFEYWYHATTLDVSGTLPSVLNGFVEAFHSDFMESYNWANLLIQAGSETKNDIALWWGKRLLQCYEDWRESRWDEVVESLTCLLDSSYLSQENQTATYASRSLAFQRNGQLDRSLADCDLVVELNKNSSWAYARRGKVHRLLGNLDIALRDYNSSLDLDSGCAWVLASRGEAHRLLHKYGRAIADLDRAIELDSKYLWAISQRAMTYKNLGNYKAALVDFDRAIELNQAYIGAIGGRGETFRLSGEYEKALADFNRAIANLSSADRSYVWILSSRGETYRQMGSFVEAVNDLEVALNQDANYVWALARKGRALCQLGDFDRSLVDLNSAIAKTDNKYDWALACRGELYRLLGEHERALADLDRAISLSEEQGHCSNDRFAWAYACRARTLAEMGRSKEVFSNLRIANRAGLLAQPAIFIDGCAPSAWASVKNIAREVS